jgi:hypothetical protein
MANFGTSAMTAFKVTVAIIVTGFIMSFGIAHSEGAVFYVACVFLWPVVWMISSASKLTGTYLVFFWLVALLGEYCYVLAMVHLVRVLKEKVPFEN